MLRLLPLLVGVVALGFVAPLASAAQEPQDPSPPDPTLDRHQAAEVADEVADELSDAVRTLEDIEDAIERAERDVAAAEQRLREASDAVSGLERDIEAARAGVRAAERMASAAARRLTAAEARLARANAAETTAMEQLRDRSVEVFKYGAGEHQRAVVTGIVGAGDLHEVVFATRAVSRIVRSDRELLQDAESARDAAAEAKVDADRARREAAASASRSRVEEAALHDLLAEQEAAVAAVERERVEREAVLEELRGDSEVAELLVGRLAEELERLEKIVSTPPPPPSPATELPPTVETDGPAAPDVGDLPVWADRLPPAGRPWAARIDVAAVANGVDGRLLAALVWTESGFNPTTVSWAGAIGLTQLMPGTAASLGVDPWDPDQNLDGGARYLAKQHARFGSLELALAAYNAGPNAVQAAGPGIPQNVETPLYVVRVLERYNHIAR